MDATEICNQALVKIMDYPDGTQITTKEILEFIGVMPYSFTMELRSEMIAETFLKYAKDYRALEAPHVLSKPSQLNQPPKLPKSQ